MGEYLRINICICDCHIKFNLQKAVIHAPTGPWFFFGTCLSKCKGYDQLRIFIKKQPLSRESVGNALVCIKLTLGCLQFRKC